MSRAQQGGEGRSRAAFGVTIAEQTRRVVVREDDAVQVVSELLRVDAAAEVPLTNRTTRGARQRLQPVALQLDQPITGGPGAIIEVHGGLHEDAAAWSLLPAEPPIEQRLEPRQPALDEQGGPDTEATKRSAAPSST